MTGFFSAVIGELLTGKGVIGQLNLETSLPPYVIKGLIAAIVGFNLVTALLPNATFSEENQQDVRKRPAGESACHAVKGGAAGQHTSGCREHLLWLVPVYLLWAGPAGQGIVSSCSWQH